MIYPDHEGEFSLCKINKTIIIKEQKEHTFLNETKQFPVKVTLH